MKRGNYLEESNKKKRLSKGVIIAIIAAILVIGGVVAAVTLTNTSPKQSYFLAEKKTLDHLKSTLEERYQPELDWTEQTYENPVEQSMDLSAQYLGPTGTSGYEEVDPAQIINNSSLSATVKTDMENKQMVTELAGNFAGLEIDGIEVYMTDEKIMLGAPFLDNYLQIKDEDFGPLLKEIDPMTFTGEESLELDTIFNRFHSDEDLEYLKSEYGELIYNELPDDAFTTSDETIEVNGESLKTEKIVLHLSEKQVQDLLSTVFEKMEKDDRLKELIKKQLMSVQMGEVAVDQELNQILTDFEDALAKAKEDVYDIHIKDGIKSTIWVHDDLITKRDLKVEVGSNEDDLVAFTINGTQFFDDSTQTFDYDLGFADTVSEGSMNISGDLSWKDNQANDSIKLTVDNHEISYEGTETLEDGTRDFERVFSYNDSTVNGSLTWDGSASYDKDKMNGEHKLTLETSETGNLITLNLAVDGQLIDAIESPAEDNVKDLGTMSMEELSQYMETKVIPDFQNWLYETMGGADGF